jgi:hypothetical protein
MPREQYTFRPAPSMRTFAALMLDLATTNAETMAQAKDVEPPMQPPAETADKAAIVFYLSETLLWCLKMVESLSDADLERMLAVPGEPSVAVRSLVLDGLTQTSQHCGYAQVYLWLKGIKPPYDL